MADEDQIIEAPETNDSPDQDQSTSGQPPAAGPAPIQPPRPQQPPIQVVAAHPKAQLFHSILNTLGGGDKTQYSVDPQTGAMSVTRVPQTTGQLAKGIIAGALTGMFAGASEHGPGSEGRSAAAGFQAAQQQRVQQQAQQQQQAKEDFDRQQQTKVRQAQIMKANYDAMKSAYALGKENDEQKDKIIANHADDLAQWTNTGAVKDKNVPSDELLKKGYDPSKYIAVPDGKVAAFNSDGSRATKDGVPLSQITYSVIDGTTQAPLSQEKYDKMVKYGLQRQGTSAKIPEGATISSAVLAQMNHRMDLIDQTQHEVDDQIGPGKVDVLAKIKENPEGYVRAIEALHNDGASTQLDNQVNNLQGKNAGAAGLVRDLIGNDNLEGLKDARTNREAEQKAASAEKGRVAEEPISPNNAATILADPKASKDRKDQAQKVLDTDVTFSARKARKDAEARKAVEKETSEDDLDQLAKNIVAGDVVATMTDISSYRQSERAKLSNAIVREAKAAGKDPKEFEPAKLRAKSDVIKDFGSGKAADQLVAFNTFLGHADDALTANDNWRRANSPLINKPINWLATNATNNQDFQKFQEALIPVQKEFMGFLNANRAEHESDIEQMKTVLDDKKTPAQVETALKALGNSADIRLAQLGRKYSNTIGQPYPTLVSPEGQAALQKMGIQSRAQANSAPRNQQNTAPEGTIINVNGQQQIKQNGKWVPYAGK
jgi:hypothetical protein